MPQEQPITWGYSQEEQIKMFLSTIKLEKKQNINMMVDTCLI